MLLNDKELQFKLQRDGYIVVPFLNANEVKLLNEFYVQVHNNEAPPDFIEDIHMTTWCGNSEYKNSVSKGLAKIFEEPSRWLFSNYRRLNHVFIVKKSGKHTTFKVHQDWNVVDETKYESVNVWVPLHDVDEQSGALWVLKGSHRINRPVRGAGYLFPDYAPHSAELQKRALSVKLKAGQAIIFYHSLIHGSPPNLAPEMRRAACFTVIPGQAPLCIYFQPSASDPLRQYSPPDDFMFRYKHLRTETFYLPPSELPVSEMPPFENKMVISDELNPFLNKRRGLFSFFRR